MSLVGASERLMYASFLTVSLFYICYFFVLYYFYKKSRIGQETSGVDCPRVSLIVPIYNEDKIIAKKLQNIEKINYPGGKIEVVFVDGHSTDKTVDIIKDYLRNCNKCVRLIEQSKREGYSHAVIEGILKSEGEIIVTTDAASYHDPDAIRHLVKHFENSEVGAVTGKEIVLGSSENLGSQLEESYRFFYDFMRDAETKMDSTPDSKGEILAIRRNICYSLMAKIDLSPNASFDSCVPYQAKMMGYRTIYDRDAKYYEHAPASFVDRMKQQARRATVLIGAMFLFKEMLLNKRHGRFGLVILPVHFAMQCFLPWIFLFGVIGFLILSVIEPLKTLLLWIIVVGAIVASRKSRLFLISFVQSQIALAIAIFRLAIRKKSLIIDTIPSTRGQ